MKKALILLFTLLLSIPLISKDIVIEHPPFSVRNSSTLEIEKIILKKDCTIIHFAGHLPSKWWLRIASDTYIRTNGQKLSVRSSEGLTLDQETNLDDTGKHLFSLTFPPIDPKTQQIDFIESDCDDCRKIWGIELQSKTLTQRIKIPGEIKNTPTDPNDLNNLQAQNFKNGKATLKGELAGYQPEMKYTAEVYVYNPITGSREEYENIPIDESGRFEASIPVFTTTEIRLVIQQVLNKTFWVSPDEESVLFLDLQQKYLQESKSRTDKCPEAQWIYFAGANSGINNQLTSISFRDLPHTIFADDQITRDVAGMSASEYREYILDKLTRAVSEINQKDLSQKTKDFVALTFQLKACELLLNGKEILIDAYRKANGIGERDELTGYEWPVFDTDYFHFLRDMPVNDPVALYSMDYSSLVYYFNYITYRLSDWNTFNRSIEKDAVQELITSGEMSPEEIEYFQAARSKDSTTLKKFSEEFTAHFSRKYKDKLQSTLQRLSKEKRTEILTNILGTDRGILFTLLELQGYTGKMEEMIPLKEAELAEIARFSDPFYYEYIKEKNQELLARIAHNKLKTGYTVHPVPEVENEALFNAITEPFAGKVVFIDCWATWCIPCRSSIKQLEPYKEHYKEKGVVFLYLTDESSPVPTWENMITDIKGEHFRMTYDQFRFLKNKFGVQGIPAYLILDKEGKQIFFKIGAGNPSELTDVLDKATK